MSASRDPVDRLRIVLELERQKKFADDAVVGGLDSFFLRFVQDNYVTVSHPVSRMLQSLPPGGYRALHPIQRRRVVEELLAETRTGNLSGPPGGTMALPSAQLDDSSQTPAGAPEKVYDSDQIKRSVRGRERIRLDALSGFEFESFCAMVFDRLGYGEVENLPSGADKGRDLIIRGERKIVVECKHQPKAAIGRPVVQKLHSAVISERADAGWLVTSGGFTRQAKEHAAEIGRSGIELKLVDRAMLLDMADRADLEILGKFEKQVMVVISPTQEQIFRKVDETLSPRLMREPSRTALAGCLSIENVTLVPVLSAIYDAHQDWFTGTGIRRKLLHAVHLTGESLIVNAHTPKAVEEPVADFVRNAPLRKSTEESLPVGSTVVDRLSSESTLDDVRESIRHAVLFAHSLRLLHDASNGRRYWRDCRVSDRNIFVGDVTEILLAHWHLTCRLEDQTYGITCLAHPEGLLVRETNLFKCRICLKEIDGAAVVCDYCGNVSHPRSFRRRHSARCSSCHRTLCARCVAKVRLFWPLTKRYCTDCV
jgi:hypothetical protein